MTLSLKEIQDAALKYKDSKGYVDSWDIYDHQLDQIQTNYSPMGGTQEKACSGCQFFVGAGNSCIIVKGDIAPNGVCDYFMLPQPEVMEPKPMYIVANPMGGGMEKVSKSRNLLQQLIYYIKGEPTNPFVLFKSEDGTLRFFCFYSNCFKDRDGEILTAAAHQEYVDWATKSAEYPELWIWHTKGTRIGKVDWLDFDGTFAYASGTIDAESTDIAYKLADKESELGISHGFIAPYEKPGGIIDWYRSFEISVLPTVKASNVITGINLLKESDDMAFTAEKRKFLLDVGLTEEAVTTMEAGKESLAKQLKDLGLEYKGDEAEGEKAPEVPSAEAISILGAQITELTGAVSALTGLVGTQSEEIKSLKESDTEKITKKFEAAVNAGTGVRASESETNIKDGDLPATKSDVSWFTDGVIGGALEALSGKRS